MRVALELDDLRIMLRRERQRATRIAAQVEGVADLDDVPTGAVAQAHQLHRVAVRGNGRSSESATVKPSRGQLPSPNDQLVRDLLQHLSAKHVATLMSTAPS